MDLMARYPDNYFDFIYVDVDHEASSVFQDAGVCFSLLKPGGIMALDDYLLGLKYPDSPGSLAVTQHPKETIDFFLKIFKRFFCKLLRRIKVYFHTKFRTSSLKND